MASKSTRNFIRLLVGGFTGLTTVALAQDAMFINSLGNIGIGTNTPAATLHLERPTNAVLRVENTSTTRAERLPFEIVNKGKTRFVIAQIGGASWSFDNDNSFFNISQIGTGINEFRVEGNGDAHIRGTSFAANHVNTSSRSVKTDIRPVEELSILSKLAELEISKWRFVDDATGLTHIGPMAEDFQTLFNLGDGEHISTVDTAGIALAGIKGLNKEIERLRKELRRGQQTIDTLRQRNASLEARLTEIERYLANSNESFETAAFRNTELR